MSRNKEQANGRKTTVMSRVKADSENQEVIDGYDYLVNSSSATDLSLIHIFSSNAAYTSFRPQLGQKLAPFVFVPQSGQKLGAALPEVPLPVPPAAAGAACCPPATF